jgi:MFS superfamily sulfate permease-like transporter
MTLFLTGLFSAIVSGCFVACVMGALVSASRSSRKEEEGGAPEVALIFSHFQHPDDSGSKLSVRVHSQSVPQLSRRADG